MRKFVGMEEKDFQNVLRIIEDGDKTELNCNLSPLKNSLYISSEYGDTELYIKKTLDTIVISKVCFKNKRQGTMTKVLGEIIRITQSYGSIRSVSDVIQRHQKGD